MTSKWKHHGVRVVHAQRARHEHARRRPGMNRAAAITHARAGAEKLWAGTVVIHPKAKTGAHHHGPVESVIYVVSGTRAHALGRPARVHRRGRARATSSTCRRTCRTRRSTPATTSRCRACWCAAARSRWSSISTFPSVERTRGSALGGQHPPAIPAADPARQARWRKRAARRRDVRSTLAWRRLARSAAQLAQRARPAASGQRLAGQELAQQRAEQQRGARHHARMPPCDAEHALRGRRCQRLPCHGRSRRARRGAEAPPGVRRGVAAARGVLRRLAILAARCALRVPAAVFALFPGAALAVLVPTLPFSSWAVAAAPSRSAAGPARRASRARARRPT